MRINGKNFQRKEILRHVGSLSQLAGAYKYMLEDGMGKGTSMIHVRNGSGLDLNLIADKCLDIFDITFNGTQLAWISNNALVSNKHFEDNGDRWLRSFGGGMLVTCGLRNAGPAETDLGEAFGLHGRVSAIPAKNVSIRDFWKENVYYQEISGQIRESKVFGENMVIYRTILVNSASAEIDLFDRIVNEGFASQQLMVLYHLNWGFPLLDENSKLIINSSNTLLRGEDQSEAELWGTFSKPIHGYNEKVYFHDLIPDKNNIVQYQLNNPDIGIGVKVSWDKKQLPFLTEWKMTGESEYVLGLEPGNSYPIGRKATQEAGDIEFLESFQEKDIHLKISFEEV